MGDHETGSVYRFMGIDRFVDHLVSQWYAKREKGQGYDPVFNAPGFFYFAFRGHHFVPVTWPDQYKICQPEIAKRFPAACFLQYLPPSCASCKRSEADRE